MSIRIVPIATATTLAVGLGAAGVLTANAAVPAIVPGTSTTEVVAGSLSPATFQASLTRALEEKKAADITAMREAVAANLAAQAEAAAAAASSTASAPAATSASAATTTTAAAADTSGASGDVAAWANSSKAMSVKSCESGNNYSTNTGNGYYGAWQFDIPSWLANGGGAYAATPDQAPAWAQDQVAYNYYQSAGWGPWSCG